uniref:Uncharacterized protein n=1 Tax=Tanacetum cinerariifolium TaxID=118510 RepID=A0A6L2N935_TANCI|nr:hypothetical protein [Tanacetum cinerariifolium]
MLVPQQQQDVEDAAEDEDDVNEGRLEESQAKVYQLDLEHAEKVLIMQDTDEAELAEVEEVIEVVTAAKLMTEVVTTIATTITAAQVPKASAPRKRRGVVIQDPEETATASVIVHSEMDFFRGMTYNEIRPIFEKHYNLNQAFLERVEEEVIGQEEEGNKRKSESPKQRAAKKQRIDEEEEELKRHLQIVVNDDDDIFTEATPLALKVPVVVYQIYYENNKPFYNIIRTDGTHKLFLSFITILKNFDRDDLEMTWKLVQERFQSSEPKNFSDDFLLNTLKTMFEKPNVEASIWRDQRGRYRLAKVKSWKLYESCGVHIITFTTTQMILLVERKYPLTRFTLEQLLNNVRLEVEEESEMSLELLRNRYALSFNAYCKPIRVILVPLKGALRQILSKHGYFRWPKKFFGGGVVTEKGFPVRVERNRRIRNSDSVTDLEDCSNESSESSVPRETSFKDDVVVRSSDKPYSEPYINPEIQAEINECISYANALRAEGINARVVVETTAREEVNTSIRSMVEVRVDRVTHVVVSDDIPKPSQEEGAIGVTYDTLGDMGSGAPDCSYGSVECCSVREDQTMPNTRSGSTMTHEAVDNLIGHRVAEALAARDTARNPEPLAEGGDEQGGKNGDDYKGGNKGVNGNGNDNGNEGGNGNGNDNGNDNGNGNRNRNGNREGNGYENHNMNFRGFRHVA